jgi:4-hydroxybenzoate polyprenyltransferase
LAHKQEVSEPTTVDVGLLETGKALLIAMRPKQWTKNVLMFAGLIFSLRLFEPSLVLTSVFAFILFCLVSSIIYLVNDLADIESDRQHPIKRYRPIAAGRVRPWQAVVLAVVLGAITIPAAFLINWRFGLLIVTYGLLNLAYSFGIKHIVILDVFAISAGFVIRVVAGAVAIEVAISPWLYVVTLLGALFIALNKRRHEITLLQDGASSHRRILQEYNPALLDQMTNIVTASIVMAYSLYTFSAENLPRNHSMMLTVPFVLYGIFRYLYLIHMKGAGGSPEDVILRDRPLLFDVILWGLTSVLILYFL